MLKRVDDFLSGREQEGVGPPEVRRVVDHGPAFRMRFVEVAFQGKQRSGSMFLETKGGRMGLPGVQPPAVPAERRLGIFSGCVLHQSLRIEESDDLAMDE